MCFKDGMGSDRESDVEVVGVNLGVRGGRMCDKFYLRVRIMERIVCV